MSDIFISHVEEDQAIALDIAAGLEAAGYSCWYYERDGLPGVRYLVQIDKAIEQAQAIVVVISRDSLSSSQVDAEVERAHEGAKHFIPILRAIKHVEFQNRKPVWRMAMGTATSLPIPVEGVSAIIPRIVAGAQELGIERHPNRIIGSPDMAATEPAESPERKGLRVLGQEKESMDSNSSIAAPETTAKTSASSAEEAPRYDPELSNGMSFFDWLPRRSLGRSKILAVVAASFVLLISLLLMVKHYRSPREPQKNPVAVDYTKIAVLRTLKSGGNGLLSLALSPDGKTLACGHDDRTATLLNTETGQLIRSWTAATSSIISPGRVVSVGFSPDGKTLATSGGLDRTVRLWDVQTGDLKREWSTINNWVGSIVFSPDGKNLASGTYEGFVLWDTQTGATKFENYNPSAASAASMIKSLVFSPSGKTFATGGAGPPWDSAARLWDAQSGALLQTFKRNESGIDGVAFSPDGDFLASALTGYKPKDSIDSSRAGIEIDIWNVRTGELKKVLTGPASGFSSVVFLPDGKTLASGSYDGLVRIWDAESGKLLRTLSDGQSETPGKVSWVSLSNDGRLLAGGSSDGTVMLWEIKQ